MMNWKQWPWSNRETRDSSYTDTLIQTIVNQASGSTLAQPAATGALESCASIIARCFAAATVKGPDVFMKALGPGVLSHVARSLIRQGESVLYMDVRDGRLSLMPCAFWDVDGDAEPETWRYRLTVPGPDRYTTLERVPATGVVHVRYMTDPGRPWLGVGPLQSASLAGRLSAEVSQSLADEASGPRGSLLPTPTDGNDETMTAFKADLRNLKGKLALVESANVGSFDNAGGRVVPSEWTPRRLGLNPPQAAVNLADLAFREVFAACGVPLSLAIDSDGTGQRESYRRLLHSTVVPLAKIVSEELTDKLETDVSLSFDSLFAADLSGRARAFQSLVGGGMDPTKAAGLSGLMEAE